MKTMFQLFPCLLLFGVFIPLHPDTNVESTDDLRKIRVCWDNPIGKTICISVDTPVKIVNRHANDISKITVKARMSRKGDKLHLSGFPKEFNGKSLKIGPGQASGFSYKNVAMVLKAGEYKVSRGQTSVFDDRVIPAWSNSGAE